MMRYLGAFLGVLLSGAAVAQQVPHPAPMSLPANNVALKTLTSAINNRAARLGFLTAGDGGYAEYNWSGANCLAADDGAQVQPTGATGCWIADFSSATPTPMIWGAKCDGGLGTHDEVAVQAALTAVPRVYFPPKCVIGATVTIPSNRVLTGSSNASYGTNSGGMPSLICRTGATDCLRVDGSWVTFENFSIDGSAQTGGASLFLNSANQTQLFFNNVAIFNSYNGVNISAGNNIVFHNSFINLARGQYALKWDSATTTSDLLTLTDTVIACGYNATPANTADGIVWDGNTKTLDMTNVPILRCNHGIKVQNSRGQANFPQFLFATHLQVEGATSNAILASSGSSFWINNSYLKNQPSTDQGNADGPVLLLSCDPVAGVACGSAPNGASVQMLMNNTQVFGNTTGPCLSIDWQLVQITNSTAQLCSLSNTNAAPKVFYGAHAGRNILTGNILDDGTGKYAVQTTAGGGGLLLKDNLLAGLTALVSIAAGTADGVNKTIQWFVNIVSATTVTTPVTGLSMVMTVVCTPSNTLAGGLYSVQLVTTPPSITVTQQNSASVPYNCIIGGY